MAHKHPVYDTDKHFVIDPITKKISTECPKLILAQHSHNSERFTFEIPKEVEGHDMSLCNLVEIHYQNIEAVNKSNKNISIYKVDDLTTDGDTVFGSWLIDGKATHYVGGLIFAMHFACVAEDGKVEYNLPTLSYSKITIGETVWNSETIANEYPELLADFEARIAALEAGGGAVTDEQIAQAVSDYMEENPVEAPDIDLTGVVKSVNGNTPDSTGNVEITIPGSSQNVDLTGYAKEQWVQEGFQPKGNYLTEVPDGYAKTEDIPTKPEDIGAQPKGNYLTAVPAGYATEEFVKNKIAEAELGGEEVDLSGYAQKSELPTKVSQLQNDSGYLTAVPDGYAKTEDIPKNPADIGAQPAGNYALKTEIPPVPVQSVNEKTGAVKLSASDVGARPDNWMPTAQEVGALPSTYTPPNQTAAQVGADPKGTAATAVGEHNVDTDAHNDIRLELKSLSDRLTAFFDSDDTTLDELSEIVAYITSNKTLIDSITTSKVNVADIVNNLTTNVANKPLSAAQGVVLKGLIDTLNTNLGNYALKTAIPTKLSQMTNDAGFITGYTETDPTVPAWAKASSKPSYSKSEVGLGNVDNVKQYSASNPPPYPVTSVNGKTGAVTVAVPTVPTKVSAFTNDAGYAKTTDIPAVATKAMTKAEYSALTAESVAQLYDDGIRMIIVEDGYTNLVPKSTDAAGNVYRGCGYRNGYRLTSSGDMMESDNCCVSGFMPYTHGSTIRIVGSCGDVLTNGGQYVGVYDASYNLIKMDYASSIVATWNPRADGLYEMAIDTSKMTAWSGAKYFRVSCLMCVGADLVVTVNEPIGLEV